MSQTHLVLDFPIESPADAKALADELPALTPDLARTQDDLGTVHFSRFMLVGDSKLLFLSDVDGDGEQHIERLVERAAPLFDAILGHVESPPRTPVAENRDQVVKWLRHHVREPLDTYYAYDDASVQDIKTAASEAGFTGSTEQHTLLTYMTIKSRLQGFALRLAAKTFTDDAHAASDSIGTLHVAHFVGFEHNHLGFFTVFDGDMEKYFQDFAEKTAMTFDALFKHIEDPGPRPVAQNAHGFYEWGVKHNYEPIGFYSAYPGLGVQDIRALLADRASQPATV